ncbi:MAG: hypothetical protein RR048_01835 [Oscillospiraceae bacterium]
MQENNKKTRKVRSGTLIGIVFSILAVIGLITVIASGYNFTKKILDNESQKEKFESVILPVLMLDPVPFDDAKNLDEVTILRASLWTAIGEKRETYSYDDLGNMIVPKSDVDVCGSRLFGKNVEIKHQSFSEGLLIRYIYDEENLLYRVPMDAQTGYYVPKVEQIVKKGDTFILSVGYLPPGNAWAMSVKGQKLEPTPDKYMLYELKEVDNGYQLLSIKEDQSHKILGNTEQENLHETTKTDEQNRVVETQSEKDDTSKVNNG